MTERNIGDLLPLSQAQIGAGLIETVSARALHGYLEVGRDFSDWMKDRITAYGFVEDHDYVVVEDLSSPKSGSPKARSQRTKEYHLTLDMAKELAMVERNAKGKEARRYFIHCEQVAKAAARGLSARQHGGITKAVVNKALDDRLEPLERAVLSIADRVRLLTQDPGAYTSEEFRPVLDVLVEADVQPKGRRGLSVRCSRSLVDYCLRNRRQTEVRLSRETRRRLFHVNAIADWRSTEGDLLIQAHKAKVAGQGVMAFKPRAVPDAKPEVTG